MTIFLSILIQGLIYSLMALGVYITYSILDFPDRKYRIHGRR